MHSGSNELSPLFSNKRRGVSGLGYGLLVVIIDIEGLDDGDSLLDV